MMVVNTSGDNSEPSSRAMLASKALSHRRRRSKGTIAGFASGKSGEIASSSPGATAESTTDTSAPSDPPGPSSLATSTNSGSNSQQQHPNDTPSAPSKPCHSARLALMCSQNAIRMGARTQLGLCPPGRARRGLKAALKQKQKAARSARNRALTAQAPMDTGGYFGVDKMLGADVLENYPTQEETFLITTNTFDAESDEEASSGDDDDLNDFELLTSEDSPALDDEEKYKNLNEPLFTPIGAENSLTNNPSVSMSGAMGSGKLPFNRRKLRYFDSISAADRIAARAYLNAEMKRSKQREVAMLSRRLRQIQRRERRRIKEEKGLPLAKADLSDDEESSKGKSNIPPNVEKFEHAMLPATAAALLVESLSLNPLESIDGMAKCYDGIVAAGVALLEANVNDPTSPTNESERRTRTRSEIMAALTPVLITSLEQPSGDVILSLARLRRMCGTARYQRRFVQRIGPSLIRPPDAAMWCLKHQNDMEPILAAAELIFDSANEIFSKGWRDRGDLLLADSKRAETLQTAAMQLRSLRTEPGESFMLGNSLTGHGGWRTRVHKEGSKGSNESLAEWEVIAVDRQIRVSISNIISMDWSPVVVQSRDVELARTYHRTRQSVKRPAALPSSTSGDMSPKITSPSPHSPARASISKTPNSPRPFAPPTERPDPSDTLATARSRPEPSESRSKSPIPPFPPPPSHPSPLSPPPPHRASADDIESRIQTDQVVPSPASVPVPPPPSSTPPRSPTPQSPKKAEASLAEIPMFPSVKPIASSPLSPSIRPLSNVKQSISGSMASSPNLPHEKQSAPLSPSSVGTGASHDNMPARFMSSASSVSSGMTGTIGSQPAHYRMLTSTAAERKRTVAACRALRAQITRFEDAFIQLHGRPPKGAAERAPLATTYAQYREWKRAIRADAACRIQALIRGARVRLKLLRRNDPRVARIVMARAGRQDSVIGSRRPPNQENLLKNLSIPAEIGEAPLSNPEIVPAPVGSIGPDGFPTLGSTGQSLPPQWGNQVVRRRSSGASDGFNGSPSPAARPAASTSSGASVSSAGSAELSRLSLSELQARKRELKQQLKQYDMNFARRHGRMPVKAEKEPIRHLYERYNALKSQIGSMEQESTRSGASSMASLPQSSGVLSQRTTSPVPTVESSGDESPAASRRARGVQRAPPGASSSTSSAPSQDLAGLKAEKQRLHQMLRSYERDFFREHKRQVSSFADIRPVAGQYRRYKEIKKAIAAIQQNVDR